MPSRDIGRVDRRQGTARLGLNHLERVVLLDCANPADLRDRWSSLIIRDCFMEPADSTTFTRRLGIALNILCAAAQNGLSILVCWRGSLTNSNSCATEYHLTKMGLDLLSCPLAMLTWQTLAAQCQRGIILRIVVPSAFHAIFDLRAL